MNTLFVIIKKELIEFLRTYKLLILGTVFLLFAIMSPLTAKFLPEILAMTLPEEIANSFPEATGINSWEQFFKNFSQMGSLVVILIFSGFLLNERTDGTLLILLTKGLARKTVIFAKLVVAMGLWTIAYWIAFGVTYFYTWYYWPDETISNLGIAVAHLWLFGLFLIALLILGNVLFDRIFSNLLFVVCCIGALFILSIFPKLDRFNVLQLSSSNYEILVNGYEFKDYVWNYSITIGAIVLFTYLAVFFFNRKTLT